MMKKQASFKRPESSTPEKGTFHSRLDWGEVFYPDPLSFPVFLLKVGAVWSISAAMVWRAGGEGTGFLFALATGLLACWLLIDRAMDMLLSGVWVLEDGAIFASSRHFISLQNAMTRSHQSTFYTDTASDICFFVNPKDIVSIRLINKPEKSAFRKDNVYPLYMNFPEWLLDQFTPRLLVRRITYYRSREAQKDFFNDKTLRKTLLPFLLLKTGYLDKTVIELRVKNLVEWDSEGTRESRDQGPTKGATNRENTLGETGFYLAPAHAKELIRLIQAGPALSRRISGGTS